VSRATWLARARRYRAAGDLAEADNCTGWARHANRHLVELLQLAREQRS
jgi:hypothetical protein